MRPHRSQTSPPTCMSLLACTTPRCGRDCASGIVLTTWIDEAGEGETDDLGELWSRIRAEIEASRALVLYLRPGDFPLKGALIEVGMALAMGKPVHVAMRGVEVEPRSMRPIGSWLHHPLVTRYLGENDLDDAMRAATASGDQNGQDGAAA